MTTMDPEVKPGRRKQTLLSSLYGKCRRSAAVAGILKVEWKAVNDMHVVVFDNDGMGDEEGRAVRGSSKRVEIVALLVPSAEKLYLAVREKYFIESLRRQL